VKLYLDVSCLNRPFDDQTQIRIRQESAAVTQILEEIEAGRWEQVSSRMAVIELQAIRDERRRRRVLALLPESRIELTAPIIDRARELVLLGLGAADAVHAAAAEALQADVLLTCDDRLCRKGGRLAEELRVRIVNPVEWLKEQLDAENA
jgi:predicted nucleic acid-binding protein